MNERKTYIMIDSCEKIVDQELMKTEKCTHEEISKVWYHTKDNLSIGTPNYVCVPNSKKINVYYVIYLSRTTNENESANKMYVATRPKGGPRSHKKKEVPSVAV